MLICTMSTKMDESSEALVFKESIYADGDKPNDANGSETVASAGQTSENKSDKNYSSDDETPVQLTKKSKKRFMGLSDSDNEGVQSEKETLPYDTFEGDLRNDEDETNKVPRKGRIKSRLRMGSSSDSDTVEPKPVKNEEQQERMKNKNKIKQKFDKFLYSRGKKTEPSNNGDKSSEDESNKNSSESDNEMSSVAKIKQKIKKSMASVPSICDPDTSDEESNMSKQVVKQKGRKQQKSTKLIEAKPLRMSAKQAMENMQLIKSESNRMLREKAVSLPYHRPKALSLKDIMSRRKPALASDGKALPIKMNEEQLKQYALLLEERQKEMMELCKSETDDDDEPEQDESDPVPQVEPISVKENTETGRTNSNIEASSNNTEHLDKDTNSESKGSEENVSNLHSNTEEEEEQNNSNTDMKLVYNSSIEDDTINNDLISKENTIDTVVKGKDEAVVINEPENLEIDTTKAASESDSQLLILQFTDKYTDCSENPEKGKEPDTVSEKPQEVEETNSLKDNSEQLDTLEANNENDFFSDDDDDVNMEDIDRIIENAEIIADNDIGNVNSPLLIKDPQPYNANPKLMGAPGMVIDLDGSNPIGSKKLSGVELLKERFRYFAKLKTPEELERYKETRLKPGSLHLRLKHELEEQIAEQRSLEWAKKLEEEKQQQKEIDTILDDANEADDSIDKVKTNTEEKEEASESSDNDEEELVENDVELKDKPVKRNPMVDDEAEESSSEENDIEQNDDEVNDGVDDNGDESDESSEEESSESEEEVSTNKKGRILKAFEDSDDESPSKDVGSTENEDKAHSKTTDSQGTSQDDEIQLAQRHKSVSGDLFTSQENMSGIIEEDNISEEIPTQTFSILESRDCKDSELNSQEDVFSQPYHDPKLDAVVDGLSQNILSSQLAQPSQSQAIGDDVLALCTGKFFDNQFVSQSEIDQVNNMSQGSFVSTELPDYSNTSDDQQDFPESAKVTRHEGQVINEITTGLTAEENTLKTSHSQNSEQVIDKSTNKQLRDKIEAMDNNLKSILDELDDPEFDKPKINKFFTGSVKTDGVVDSNVKKRFIIDSDDETGEATVSKKKKLKKKKPEKRALQISDDEEEEEQDLENEYTSDVENDTERLVEYDSEENEIEVQPQIPKKKKQKPSDFFEQEAELTSEDEWVGSGDEDERGLDRMEREEGDDEVFHQGKLRNELGQIHMRDVLDQDKREVRLLQELLFEDGDLGGGHRQRKFRWRNADDGEEAELGTDLTDTQEEEFESEEQWRKQRHEREVFLRQMQNQDDKEQSLNVSITRTSIIKANLSSKSMSVLLEETKSKTDDTDTPAVPEKKTTKDIPSPKKSFAIYQQSYHGSLLTRGRGALARLAALATPLVTDDDTPKIGSLAPHKRNFVFAALTQESKETKATKRKANVSVGTPKLMKKMKIEEKQKIYSKNSLLDQINT